MHTSTIQSDPQLVADALEAVLPAIQELQDIMRDAPEHVRQRARPWLTHLDRATGSEETCTIDDTIIQLRGLHDAAQG